MHDTEHELRIETGANRLVMQRREEIAAFQVVRHAMREPRRHLGDKAQDFGT